MIFNWNSPFFDARGFTLLVELFVWIKIRGHSNSAHADKGGGGVLKNVQKSAPGDGK